MDPIFTKLPVALYARLSVNPDGKKDSVATQLSQGRQECAQRWPGRPVVEFSDDGITAGDDTVYRPGYEAMLAAIRNGEVGDVIARTQARISRHEQIWPAFKVVCLSAGILRLHTWTEGDLSMLEGESLGPDVMNLMNAHFRKIVKKNVNQTLDSRAVEGRPSGGKPFGYKLLRDGHGVSHLVVDDVEAAYVNEMAERFLWGHSFADIARWLNEEQVPTAKKAKAWRGETVKGAISNATVTGLRVHRGQIIGEGNWDAIIARDRWEAIQAILAEPRRVRRRDGVEMVATGKRRSSYGYLLSAICRCGRCGHPMLGGIVYSKSAARTPVPYYICRAGRGGCNAMAIKASCTEEFVAEKFLRWLNTPGFVRYLVTVDRDRATRDKLNNQIKAQELKSKRAGRRFADDEISEAAFDAIEARIKENVAKLRSQLVGLAPAPVTDDPRIIAQSWHSLPLCERRQLLLTCNTRVIIASATSNGRTFDDDRITPRFGV